MDRETKFRGWHAKLNRMFSCEEMVSDQLTLLTDGRFINVHGGSTKLSKIFSRYIFIPMQYINIKTVNDVEIYIDDILKLSYGGITLIGIVQQTDSGDYELWKDEGNHVGINHNRLHISILGNKWENPELLEAE